MGNNASGGQKEVIKKEEYEGEKGFTLVLNYTSEKQGDFVMRRFEPKHKSGALGCQFCEKDRTYEGSFIFRGRPSFIYLLIKHFHLDRTDWGMLPGKWKSSFDIRFNCMEGEEKLIAKKWDEEKEAVAKEVKEQNYTTIPEEGTDMHYGFYKDVLRKEKYEGVKMWGKNYGTIKKKKHVPPLIVAGYMEEVGFIELDPTTLEEIPKKQVLRLQDPNILYDHYDEGRVLVHHICWIDLKQINQNKEENEKEKET